MTYFSGIAERREIPDQQSGSNKLYDDSDALKNLLLKKKYQLDCGHCVTFGHNLGNNIVIINGAELRVICSFCY
jgi:hypothetical protein